MIQKTDFQGFEKYTISSDELSITVMTLGATLTDIVYQGKNRVLKYDDAETYLNASAYIGATVGRYANRIGGSRFELDGREVTLVPNENGNQLHGGPASWPFREWKAEAVGDSAVRFSIFSPNGENGFPGNLRASATFSVSGSSFRIDFEGDTDMPTVFAPTNHVYFNFAGTEDILDTEIQVFADSYIEPGPGLIPTGKFLPCEGKYDFRAKRKIGGNYDHAFVATGETLCRAEADGIALTLKSDLPAVQLYTGEFLCPPHKANQGFAIEPEFFPDSPNHPEWPSPVVRPGEHFHKYAEYCFETV